MGGDAPTGYERVFTRDSRLCYQQAGGMASDVEIVQPTMMNGQLMYQVRVLPRPGHAPVLHRVDARAVEESGDAGAWGYAWWNRETQCYEDPPDGVDT